MITPSLIHKVRQKLYEIGETFYPRTPLTIHWDGKIMSNLALQLRQSSRFILVSGKDVTKLLLVPKLTLGEAYIEDKAVVSEVHRGYRADPKRAICFDRNCSQETTYIYPTDIIRRRLFLRRFFLRLLYFQVPSHRHFRSVRKLLVKYKSSGLQLTSE